jgi:phage terminase large subunit GpA-like protein
MQSLEWQRIRYDDATHYCIECEEHHSKHEWTKNWEKTGVWVSQDPGHTTRGFHLSALYSPFVSWETFIEEFHKANSESKRGQLGKLQAFVNTTLGETWEIQGETADETGLMERRTEYHAEVPDGVCCYTIAVDTQDNRLCVDIIGWGAGKESWRLGYFELQGDPRIASHQVWERLDEIITQPRSYANGVVVPRACVTIDMGGHATEQVRAYAKARRAWNVWAVRGIAGDSKALLHSRVNSKLAGTFEFNLAVNAGKDDVIARLKVKEPGPGYCHFPRGWEQDSTGKYISTRGYDERYFSMLTAEKKVMVKKKDGRHKYEWQVQPNRNNEAFDLAVYNLAALEISGFPLERVAEMMPWVTDKPHPNNGVKMPMPAKERIKPAQVPLNRVTINKTGLNRQASRNTHAFL